MNATEQFELMDRYDLEQRIDQSEVDFWHKRYKSNSELLRNLNSP